jgi:DNA primase
MDNETFAKKLGLERVRLRGDEIHASCPFKERHLSGRDRTPSFSVNVEKGVFNCFSCNSRGTIEDLVSHILKVPISIACTMLEEWGFSALDRALREQEESKRPDVIPDGLLCYYALVPSTVGEIYEGDVDGNDCIIYPVRNKYGKLVGAIARSKEGRFHKVLWEMEKSHYLFGEDYIIFEEPIIIVEGPGDVFALRKSGLQNTVSLMGVHISKIQVEKLLDLSSKFIVWLDKDSAGAKGVEEVWRKLDNRAYVRYVDPWKVSDIPKKQDAKYMFETFGQGKIKEILGGAKTYLEHILEDKIESANYR